MLLWARVSTVDTPWGVECAADMIIGTAGHVDHGKTALVKALTGIDTDRLPEEKRRGITLELGFARLDLPSGRRVGVIDVPGHERFVRAMAAGAGGVDVAMLVVAADEGVMPQTREHLDICRLLGVRKGVLVITKCDLLLSLGEGWLELLGPELEALVSGTFLDGARVVQVSARTGEGLDELKAELERLVAALESTQSAESTQSTPRPADGPLFIPVDRAFTTKGFGLVVTGSLLSGRLKAGDEVDLLPGLSGPWRVRGVQAHGVGVAEVVAGGRVAINLPELDTLRVHRGMAVVRHDELHPILGLDVELTLLPMAEVPLPRRSRQLVSLGTSLLEAVVRLFDVEALRPGESCFGQLRFAEPVAAMVGQRFIVRGTRALSGRGATVGGGRVLSLGLRRRRRGAGEWLRALADAPLDERIRWFLTEAGYVGLTQAELFASASAPAKELERALDVLASKGAVVLVDKERRRYLDHRVLDALVERSLGHLDAFHRQAPEREGMSREELRQRLAVQNEKAFHRLLGVLLEGGRVEVLGDGELVRLKGRGGRFDEEARRLRNAAQEAYAKAGLAPPLVPVLAARLEASEARLIELLTAMAAEGVVVRAGPLFFDAGAVEALGRRLVEYLTEHQHRRITTQAFKELVGQSRKFSVPLAEYFDRERVTLRVGEERVLRRKWSK